MKLNKLVRAAIFAALAIGLGFSLLLIPNIELITVTIFISGLLWDQHGVCLLVEHLRLYFQALILLVPALASLHFFSVKCFL